jgi:dihydrofolate synthase/folylpolyglutamate synthase
MTYAEAIEYLFGIRLLGQKLGLETMRRLLERMGNPERALRFIHIAGTNGKGSVAAMCHAVLQAAGIRTGLYTSPHLVSFCERFQINGQPIAEAEVVRLVEHLQPLLKRHEQRAPTFFEVTTAMALQYFREQHVDVAVWETGLGGRLDATNVVTPIVSVITNVAFDHMQYLGETLPQIAAEKAGIIKPGVPVVTAARDEQALRVIRQECATRGCRLIEVMEPLDWETPLAGEHQRWNCATAVAAIRASGLPASDDQIRAGLRQTKWPGRFQVIGNVVLDGAHNAAGLAALLDALHKQFPGRPLTFIFGVLRDKNYDQMCAMLVPPANRVFCVPVNSERTSDPGHIAELCRGIRRRADIRVFPNLPAAYAAAQQSPGDLIVITGSLFLVGEALSRLGLSAGMSAPTDKELALQ